jgi:flagellar protein FlaG
MEALNADLQFVLHEKTNRMMVKIVDIKTQKVLKEFPPHELLDTLAAISEYVGALLDKKA